MGVNLIYLVEDRVWCEDGNDYLVLMEMCFLIFYVLLASHEGVCSMELVA